ncbi:hypothetical protein PX52LOC_07715 [Limnoglobus roseus]|uniref:Uncharacterized protein n=1 Tax=Limnoglobus roseus TaxID=2598579 RepID=A0A5C1ANN7_9BACT|nr:hypothetical protein PX52LOC_07715 [Limnoglobus roseus]
MVAWADGRNLRHDPAAGKVCHVPHAVIPDNIPSSHWLIILDELETKQRWADVCDNLARRNAQPPPAVHSPSAVTLLPRPNPHAPFDQLRSSP